MKPPLCPLHRTAMRHDLTTAGRDYFVCSLCTIQIDRPAGPLGGASPGLAGACDARSPISAGHEPSGETPPISEASGEA